MDRIRTVLLAAALAASLSLIAVANAGAAAWQGPTTISLPTVNASAETSIALGASGDAAAAWSDDGSGGEIVLARKPAGAAWSAPAGIISASGTPILTAVDGSGNITATYPVGNTTTLLTWAATSPASVSTPLGMPLTVTGLAVDAAGDAVLAGISGNPASLVVGYRAGPTGTFALHTYSYVSLGFSAVTASVAINASGTAIAVFTAGPHLLAATRTATADWPAAPATVESTLSVSGNPVAAIDTAGNALAAFTYATAGPTTILRSSFRPAGGGWLESGDLTSATTGTAATDVSLSVSPAGTALLVWDQSAGGSATVEAKLGSSASGAWGATEPVSDPGASSAVASIGNDGTAVAVWEQTVAGMNVGQARVRSPGAAGTWGVVKQLSPAHPNSTSPSLATDGNGDFATLSTPYNGTAHPVILSAYDAAPPVLSKVATTGGSFLAGAPIGLSVTAKDAWSSVGVPTWSFGDGATASGLGVQHTFTAAGTYTVHVSVADGSGNAASEDFPVTVVSSVRATISKLTFLAKWKRSRVSGALRVTGVAPRGGTYTINVSKGKTRRIRSSFTTTPGAFTRNLKLPATLVPGSYTVQVVPSSQLANVLAVSRAITLAAPVTGVVDVASIGASRNGKAARGLHGVRTIWARFHFAARPKGALALTWYRLGARRVRLGVLRRTPAARVVGSLALAGPGTYQAVLTRKGVVIAQASVRVK